MSFTERGKTIALAIVKIFETAKPTGDYSAVAVLADGAGISYGISQFTHKSGSLAAVIGRFVRLGGVLPDVVNDARADFQSGRNIPARSSNKALKQALAALGKDSLMQQAQREIGFENYLRPALQACEGSDFEYPLSLAVIYDSINQGGFTTVRDKVTFQGPGNGSIRPEEFEREWITRYCIERKKWLSRSKKSIVRATIYRPEFFLREIERGNWNLNLPITVHGHKLTEAILFPKVSAAVASQPEGSEILPSGSNDAQGVQAPIPADEAQPPITDENAGTPPRLVVEKEPEEGFLRKTWKKILAWLASIGGVEGVKQNAESFAFLGLSPDFLQKVVIVAVTVGILWLLYELAGHAWGKIKARWLTTTLVAANANTSDGTTVETATADSIASLERQGYTVIRRS